MSNIVSRRFKQCHDHLKDTGIIKSSRQFALSLDYHPQSLGDILKGKRDVTLELVRKAVDQYHLSADYLFTGKGSKFSNQEKAIQDTGSISYVSVAAQAGYKDQFMNPVYEDEMPIFSLPNFDCRYGVHRCFDVQGDSMEPTIYDRDAIICNLIDQNHYINNIRNNLVYVIVTDSEILVKRVKNNIRQNGTLDLISDNSFYPDMTVEIAEVREMWNLRLKISPFMPSPGNVRNNFDQEVRLLQKTIEGQGAMIRNLNGTIEKMLKIHRDKV